MPIVAATPHGLLLLLLSGVLLLHHFGVTILMILFLHLLFLQMLCNLSITEANLSGCLWWFRDSGLNASQRRVVLQGERRRSGSNM